MPFQDFVGFDYQSLRVNDQADYNVKGVNGVTINADSLSVPAWTYFYESGKIPTEQGKIMFAARLIELNSGGMRTIIDGYDSSGTLITSTGSDLLADGIGYKGFGEGFPATNTHPGADNIIVYNPDTAYVRIRLYTGGSGANFSGVYIGVRHKERNSKLFASRSAINTQSNISNVGA